jgi:hypothetical protein
MSNVVALGVGALRFVAALVVGMLMLTAAQFALLLSGGAARGLSGLIFPIGLLLVTILAFRLAFRGRLTTFDRAAATAAAGASAIGLTFVGVVAGTILAVMLLLSFLFLGAGGGGAVAAKFGPIVISAGAVFTAAMLGARGLVYAGYRMWLPRRASRWLGIATFLLVFVAVLAGIHLL